MKTYLTMAVTILAVLLLGSGGLLVTHAATPSPASSSTSQTLSLNLVGGVASAGNQNYMIAQNGPALLAVIDGLTLSNTHLTYNLNAQQQGLSTSGSASFTLTGQAGSGSSATTMTVTGNLQIGGSVPSICLPSGSVTGTCATGDTSEVPFAFMGAGAVQVTTGQSASTGNGNGWGNGNGHSTSGSTNAPTSTPETIAFESAYFNPFGDAISIASLDQSIIIVTNYTQATIDWSNGVDAGILVGTLGSTVISGTFQQVAAEHENLVQGTATDIGTITFSGVTTSPNPLVPGTSVPYMDGTGGYLGTSSIPHTGSFACPGIPYCTETGYSSHGTFLMYGGQGQNSAVISGSYATTWTVPAFGFTSVVSGHSTQTSFASAFGGKVSL